MLVIGGPTAAGKTSLAIEAARHFNTEIISGDSRQFYQEMQIGNARPDPAELAAAPHHFIADRSLHTPLTAGRFADEAMERLKAIFQQHDYAVLVGGSGLYLRALCEGLDEFPAVTDAARTQVQGIWEEQGLSGWQQLLLLLDPVSYRTVDINNPRRLQRMLEVSLSGEAPYASYLGQRPPRPFRCRYFRVSRPRPELYDRINQRVELMVTAGLEAEAHQLYPHRQLPVLQTVGYQEWWPFFAGQHPREYTLERIKQNSRRYAKRQETWFRKGNRYHPVQTMADILAVLANE